MDANILTMFFCLILLVLTVLVLNELMILKRKVNAHLDRTDLHTDKLHTILSILQQIEAKQDLLFNNAPPSPGESSIPTLYTPIEDAEMDCIPKATLRELAARVLAKHKAKVSSIVPPKKRGRPKKASKD